MTELEDESVFRLNMQPSVSYEKDYDVQMDITVEMDLNLTLIARDVYTALDWLSDIGGMQGMLIGAVAIFLSFFWNHNQFNNYMVTRLYKMEKQDSDHDDGSDFIKPGMMSN